MRSSDENWFREQQRIGRIKDGVRDLLVRGVKLGYEWDAGGDNTLCWPVTTPEEEISRELSDELYRLIVDKLQLPNAGDYYKKGSGELFFTPLEELALRYSLEESWPYDDDTVPNAFINDEIAIADPAGLGRWFSRGKIGLKLEVDWKGKKELKPDILIREGDAPELDEKATAEYTALLMPYAELLVSYFGPRDDSYVKGYVTIYCAMQSNGWAKIGGYGTYLHITEHSGKEVILLP